MAPLACIALLQIGLVMFARSLEEVFNPRLQEG
jgi:ABC-type dipeptide/oligopeptide/nickel transport system permease subunit